MYYLPSTSEVSEELFERECEKENKKIMDIIHKYDKINFIDCKDGRGSLSSTLLES